MHEICVNLDNTARSVKAALEQFVAGGGGETAGVTLLGRWHNVDSSGRFVLSDSLDSFR